MNLAPPRIRMAWIALALLGGTTVAIAASPHFVRGPDASINNDGELTVSWKEAGLGDTVSVAYEASADANATYQCVNRGGNCPAAANKQQVFGPVFAAGTFSSGKNGSITASLTVDPPPSTLNCPGNQRRELVSVSYTDIVLADTTNNVVAAADPSSLSISGEECPD